MKKYPKNKQTTQQQPKIKPPNCPSCKQKNRLEFDKGYYCQNCENNINNQKHQIDKKKFTDKNTIFLPDCQTLIKNKRNLDDYG